MRNAELDPMMIDADSLARFAGLLADRSRVVMCLAMIDGRAWTAGELATLAGINPSTASEHLTLLVGEGVLAQERQGRHRYVRIAGPEIAQFIEDLGALVGERARPNSLRTVRAAGQLAYARTCYNHLAGNLGVCLYAALIADGSLSSRDGLRLTPAGRGRLVEFAGSAAVAATPSRPLLRTCLDWTERRSHLGGSLGAAMLTELLRRRWLVRPPQRRAIAVTHAGSVGLRDLFNLDIPVLETAEKGA